MTTYQRVLIILGGIACIFVVMNISMKGVYKSASWPTVLYDDTRDSRVPKQIHYNLSLQRISNYRLTTFGSNTTYRWLFLSAFDVYRTMMDRHYFAQYYAAGRHPNIQATLWGRGFPGWIQATLSCIPAP